MRPESITAAAPAAAVAAASAGAGTALTAYELLWKEAYRLQAPELAGLRRWGYDSDGSKTDALLAGWLAGQS